MEPWCALIYGGQGVIFVLGEKSSITYSTDVDQLVRNKERLSRCICRQRRVSAVWRGTPSSSVQYSVFGVIFQSQSYLKTGCLWREKIPFLFSNQGHESQPTLFMCMHLLGACSDILNRNWLSFPSHSANPWIHLSCWVACLVVHILIQL